MEDIITNFPDEKFEKLKIIKLILNIKFVEDRKIGCRVTNETEDVYLEYLQGKRAMSFHKENHLSSVVRKNQFQFEKVISSAIKGKITPGQSINCVFIEGFIFLKDRDFNRFIRVDRRKGKLDIAANNTESKGFHKIYADGSFLCQTGQSGYGGFVQDPHDNRKFFSRSFNNCSNNMMELLAVTEGLKILEPVEKIQVNTDSRFVIRGLIQWVHFWRHNDWETAYGTKVKFAEHWQMIDKLCEGKLVEFHWIKGHSGHEAQTICHQLAIETASNSGKY